jgi:hypothetical protein
MNRIIKKKRKLKQLIKNFNSYNVLDVHISIGKNFNPREWSVLQVVGGYWIDNKATDDSWFVLEEKYINEYSKV